MGPRFISVTPTNTRECTTCLLTRAHVFLPSAHERADRSCVYQQPAFQNAFKLELFTWVSKTCKKERLRQKTSRRAINGLKDKFHISKFTQIPFKIYTLENVYGGTTMTKPSRLLTASVFRRSSKKGFQTSSNSGKTSNTERLTLRLSVLGLWRIAESVRELRF